MKITSKTKVCCIIGDPVEHSISPQIHNAGYQALGIDFVYLAFKVSNLKKSIEGLRVLGVKGIVVTIPHKIEVLKYVDKLDKDVKAIGAANTIVNEQKKLIAYNTDWSGAILALKEKASIAQKKVAVLGAGGAARAIVYGLKKENASVFVCNRTIKNAEELAKEFSLDGFASLNNKEMIKSADIIINTTSVGMHPQENSSPIPKEFLNSNQVVFDIVYTPKETQLLQMAQSIGSQVVYGDTMSINTAFPQFELFTGYKAPVSAMRKALIND